MHKGLCIIYSRCTLFRKEYKVHFKKPIQQEKINKNEKETKRNVSVEK